MTYKKFSLMRFLRSFVFASHGVINLLKTEQNARIHVISGIFVGALAYIFAITRIEAAILFIAVILTLSIEIINTAVEKLLDIVHPENAKSVEYIKDAMAGAVLVSSIISVVVTILIFLPYLKNLFI